MPNPYGPTLVEHFRHPRNRGSLPEATITQEGTNPLCGDRVRIELLVERGVVRDAKFTANACAICVAAASVLTDLVHDAPLDEVETLTVDDLLRALKAEVPRARLQCVRLPLTVLHTGVSQHRRTRGGSERVGGKVAVMVLAAGAARRFGAQKLLAPFEGSTIIRRVVDNVRSASVGQVIVVVGEDGEGIRAAMTGGGPLTWSVNRRSSQGMSTSIVAGLESLNADVSALVVALGDQPTISGSVTDRLIEAWRSGGGPIVAPRYRGLRGNPVLFDASMFDELRALEGDRGARDLIAADASRVTLVDVEESPPLDVDTAADYETLLRPQRRGA